VTWLAITSDYYMDRMTDRQTADAKTQTRRYPQRSP